jgi:hypothetical protein
MAFCLQSAKACLGGIFLKLTTREAPTLAMAVHRLQQLPAKTKYSEGICILPVQKVSEETLKTLYENDQVPKLRGVACALGLPLHSSRTPA